MAEERIRVGVVGAGWFASRRHLPDLKALVGVEVVALCRRNPEKLERVADHFEVRGRYRDYGEMLDREALDAVVVATPHALHYVQAREALERGLHVLLEKPMTLAAAEAEELIGLASKARRVLSVALNPPFWRHTCYAQEAIARGEVGRLESVAIQWIGNTEGVFGRAPLPEGMPGVVKPTFYRGDPDLSGGGHLMDTGSHLVSELLFVTGLSPRAVSAQMDDPTTDMRAEVQVALEGRVFGGVVAVGDSQCPERRIQNFYFGSEGTLTVEGMPFRVKLERPGEETVTVGEEEMPERPGPVANFVDGIRGKAELFSPGAHGAAVVRVIEAAYQSARTGQRVALKG